PRVTRPSHRCAIAAGARRADGRSSLAPRGRVPDPPRMRILLLLASPALVLAAGPATGAQDEPRVTLEGLEPGALAPASLEDVSALGLAFVEIALERDTY